MPYVSEIERLALSVQLPGLRGPTLTDDWRVLLAEGLGGICLFGGNLPFSPLVGSVRALAPEAVVAVDEEGGDVTRLYAATGSPVLGHAALGVLDDPALTRDTAATIGGSLRDLGVDLDFGPVADVNSNPLNPVIGSRSFGASVDLVARHVAAYVEGLQSAGVGACAKHFPGHGDTHEDSHLATPCVDTLPDLAPFAAAVTAGTVAVMTSHIVVSSVDADRPATMSPHVLDRLRTGLGYEGMVVTDALDMAGASATRGVPAAAVAALAAGCDLLCLGPGRDVGMVRQVQAAVVAAVRDGTLQADRLAEAAGRVASRPRLVGRGLPLDRARQLAAARSALRVDGAMPHLGRAVLTRIDGEWSNAAAQVSWGLPGQAIDPATYDAGSMSPEVTVVLQTRDAHRHPDQLALVQRLPRVVVVDYGWPGPWPLSVPRICTHGTSVPTRLAVAELLAQHGYPAERQTFLSCE